jgi:hypothetical protein
MSAMKRFLMVSLIGLMACGGSAKSSQGPQNVEKGSGSEGGQKSGDDSENQSKDGVSNDSTKAPNR